MGDEEQIDDEVLLQAIRKRLRDEISQGGRASQITNNVYGGGVAGGGVRDQMGGESGGEDPRDYFVDIMREDLPEINEATGKPKGWKKTVHRFSTSKKKDLMGE
jgi:hypothetical protein